MYDYCKLADMFLLLEVHQVNYLANIALKFLKYCCICDCLHAQNILVLPLFQKTKTLKMNIPLISRLHAAVHTQINNSIIPLSFVHPPFHNGVAIFANIQKPSRCLKVGVLPPLTRNVGFFFVHA